MIEYNTIIGPNTSFKGTVKLDSPFLIEGKYEGKIESTSDIVVGEKGVLTGEIKCHNLTVYGASDGNVECSDTMTIIPGGSHTGNITTKNLCMERGSLFDGKIKMIK